MIEIESATGFRHPSNDPSWRACDQCMIRHITRDYCSGCDQREAANCDAAYQSGIGANAGAAMNLDRAKPALVLVALYCFRKSRRTRHQVVGENSGGSNEDIVL